MKDNHNIHQNQTVKININNAPKRTSSRRRNNKPNSIGGGFGGEKVYQ